MHNRSGAARKTIVSPAEPNSGEVLSRLWSVSRRKAATCLASKQRFRRKCRPVSSCLYESRETCSPHSRRSLRLVTARDGGCAAFRAAILSGIPNVRIALFRQCPVSARDVLLATNSRRARGIPLAREDIPDKNFIAYVQHLRLARM